MKNKKQKKTRLRDAVRYLNRQELVEFLEGTREATLKDGSKTPFTEDHYRQLFFDDENNDLVSYSRRALSEVKMKWDKENTNAEIVDRLIDKWRNEPDYSNSNKPSYKDEYWESINAIAQSRKLGDRTVNKLLSFIDDSEKGSLVFPGIWDNKLSLKNYHKYKFIQDNQNDRDVLKANGTNLIENSDNDEILQNMMFGTKDRLEQWSESTVTSFLRSKVVTDENAEVGEYSRSKFDISDDILLHAVDTHHYLFNKRDSFPMLMNSLSDENRKKLIDDKIGLTGSDYVAFDTPDNYDLNNPSEAEEWDKLNWQSMSMGGGYNALFAESCARSKYLDDEQIEFIKRHGDFDDRYDLYHNPNIDPKHGVEMYNKWANDEHDDGYDSDELIEKYREVKADVFTIDDLAEGTIDEDDLYETADEAARNAYDFDSFMYDHADDLAKDHLGSGDYDEEIKEELDVYDWEGENPDYTAHSDRCNNIIDYLEDIVEGNSINQGDIQNLIQAVDDGKIETSRAALVEVTDKLYSIEPDLKTDPDAYVYFDDFREDHYVPEYINFDEHDEYTIGDHPDYDERYREEEHKVIVHQMEHNPYDFYDHYSDSWYESPWYRDAWEEAMNEAKEEAAKEHFDELYELAHKDDRFIPDHIAESIPNIADIRRDRRRTTSEGGASGWLNGIIPNRHYELEYGDNVYHHELLKDYADANGGSIDMGKMIKLFPNLKDTWKGVFSGKGKLTSEDIQSKIENLPKTSYDITYGKWKDDQMQNINGQNQIIVRLDHSPNSLEEIKKDPKLYDVFKAIQETSRRSGHPTNSQSIAWARVDASDPKNWMVDEMQSDFGKTVTRFLKEKGEEEKAKAVEKIAKIHKNWREALMSQVIKLAKQTGADKVSTHSAESKGNHAGGGKVHTCYKDSYQKVPRRMGFKEIDNDKLPLNERGRKNFTLESKAEGYLRQHIMSAIKHLRSYDMLSDPQHLEQWIADGQLPNATYTSTDLLEHYNNSYKQHYKRIYEYVNSGVPFDSDPGDTPDHTMENIDRRIKRMSENIGLADQKIMVTDLKHYLSTSEKNPHVGDDLLKKPLASPEPKRLKGHTIELKPNLKLSAPKLKKSYFGIKINLFKGLPDFKSPKPDIYELPFVDPSKNHLVNAGESGFRGEMNSLPGQKELIHGLDLTTGEDVATGMSTGTKIHFNPTSNKKSIVKPATGIGAKDGTNVVTGITFQRRLGHEDIRGHNAARREVMFHNLAHNFFGLGNYVPTTAGFTKRNEDYSAQEFIDSYKLALTDYENGAYPKDIETKYLDFLKQSNDSGHLHKMALMDLIMGNDDRNRSNYVLGKDNNQLYLIDNSLAFNYATDKIQMNAPVPIYLKDAENFDLSDTIHPEAKEWVDSLSEEDAIKLWDKYGYDSNHSSVRGFITRLNNIKLMLNHPNEMTNPSKLSTIINKAYNTTFKMLESDLEQRLQEDRRKELEELEIKAIERRMRERRESMDDGESEVVTAPRSVKKSENQYVKNNLKKNARYRKKLSILFKK